MVIFYNKWENNNEIQLTKLFEKLQIIHPPPNNKHNMVIF